MADLAKRLSGFTLIEILLALLVVTVGLMSVTGLFATALGVSHQSQEDLNAVSFADMVLNYCHAETNWNRISTSGEILIPGYNLTTGNLRLDSVAQFTCQTPGSGSAAQTGYTVTYLLHISAGDRVKELTLEVWPGSGTNNTSRVFYTELYNWVDR